MNILRQKMAKGWTFYEIKNLTHHQVLSVMTDSLIFLSFGHRGFVLPVAEALASQCAVVGYDD